MAKIIMRMVRVSVEIIHLQKREVSSSYHITQDRSHLQRFSDFLNHPIIKYWKRFDVNVS